MTIGWIVEITATHDRRPLAWFYGGFPTKQLTAEGRLEQISEWTSAPGARFRGVLGDLRSAIRDAFAADKLRPDPLRPPWLLDEEAIASLADDTSIDVQFVDRD